METYLGIPRVQSTTLLNLPYLGMETAEREMKGKTGAELNLPYLGMETLGPDGAGTD